MFQSVGQMMREAWAFSRGKRKWYRVSGSSMEPTLHAGDCVLVDTTASMLPALGALVVVTHPSQKSLILIKRVGSLGALKFSVKSDNPSDSQDSRQFGPIEQASFIGPVTTCFYRDGSFKFLN
jgi:nickel-type superoxide dismutase maturation protease